MKQCLLRLRNRPGSDDATSCNFLRERLLIGQSLVQTSFTAPSSSGLVSKQSQFGSWCRWSCWDYSGLVSMQSQFGSWCRWSCWDYSGLVSMQSQSQFGSWCRWSCWDYSGLVSMQSQSSLAAGVGGHVETIVVWSACSHSSSLAADVGGHGVQVDLIVTLKLLQWVIHVYNLYKLWLDQLMCTCVYKERELIGVWKMSYLLQITLFVVNRHGYCWRLHHYQAAEILVCLSEACII